MCRISHESNVCSICDQELKSYNKTVQSGRSINVFSIYKRYVEWDRNSIAILTILFFRCCTLFVNPSSENNTLFSFSYNLFNKFRTWYRLLSYSLRYSFRLFIKKFFSNLENLFFGLIFFLEVGEFFLISFIYWADLF